MDTNETLLDLASVSEADAQQLKVDFSDTLLVTLAPSALPSFPQELTRCIVQVAVRSKHISGDEIDQRATYEQDNTSYAPEIAIHPLLLEFLVTSFASLSQHFEEIDGHSSSHDSLVPIRVTSFTEPGMVASVCETDMNIANSDGLPWKARRIQSIKTLPFGSFFCLNIVYMDDNLKEFCQKKGNFHDTLRSTLSFFLDLRILMVGTTIVLPTPVGTAIATVTYVKEYKDDASQSTSAAESVYRIDNCGGYNIEFAFDTDDVGPHKGSNTSTNHTPDVGLAWQSECPGYENLVQTLMQLATIRGSAAPSGILLTGSPQVGKTHLASCVALQLSRQSNPQFIVHWVSAQDLLLQATWANDSDLLEMLRPPTPASSSLDTFQLLVLDDLQIFTSEEDSLQEDAVTLNTDPELLVVRNSVLQIIDELTEKRNQRGLGVAILGIAQSSSNLPAAFVRSGRLEKEIVMSPPTQKEREMILRRLIPAVAAGEMDEQTVQKWAEALSPVTVSCVAGDLCRILSSAWTAASARSWNEEEGVFRPELLWEDLRKAAQTYVPIQLETVDVTKPKSYQSDFHGEDSVDPNDWVTIHKLSWQSFGGYPVVKRLLLRTVVGPWKRFLKDDDTSKSVDMGLSPPPGILFHGASGNGKSFAASCLGSSLGLPMIKVRAADVLDKWLGGSEAILRSLFARARSAAPCILMFDEIDSLATNRNGDDDGTEVMGRLLSTLLNEMDGISSDKRRHSVVVVACTNRLDDLDAALLRPGRLEEHIHLDYPKASDIRDMLQIHLKRVPLSSDLSLDVVADYLGTKQATGADVEGICREACLAAVQRTEGSEVVLLQEDIDKALRSSRLR